jgi:hypothetical protein
LPTIEGSDSQDGERAVFLKKISVPLSLLLAFLLIPLSARCIWRGRTFNIPSACRNALILPLIYIFG